MMFRRWQFTGTRRMTCLLGTVALLLFFCLFCWQRTQSLWSTHKVVHFPNATQTPVTSMMRQTSLTEEPPAVMESEMDGLAAAEETMPSGNTSKGVQKMTAHPGAWNPYIPNRIKVSHLFKPFSPAQVHPFLLPEHIMQGVHTFVFFVGIGRSGTTLLASLLDAHPNAIVANDYAFFMKWPEDPSFHRNRTLLYSAIHYQSMRQAMEHRQTSLHVSNAYLGRYQGHVSVIGDKEAGTATRFYRANKQLWMKIFAELQQTVNVPVKLIQVVRNPFDAIASFACMLTPGGDNIKRSQQTWSIANISGFKEAHASFFANQQSVLDMLHDPALPNITIHHVHMASLVHSPSQEMTRLCDYLGLTCFPSYIRACEGTIHSRLSMTRKVIQWTPEIKESIEKRMKHFPWFQGYNFTSS